MSSPSVPLPGSHRRAMSVVSRLGEMDAGERIVVTLVLRRVSPLTEPVVVGTPLTRAEFGSRFGADLRDVDTVRAVAESAGLELVDVDLASRRLRIVGPAGAMAGLFGTTLHRVRSRVGGEDVEHRYREGGLTVPEALDGIVVAVLGLDDRQQARSHTVRAVSAATSYTPVQLAAIYAMPSGTDGAGETVAVIELGGGFAVSDLEEYFTGLKAPVPSVTAVLVDGAQNLPGQDPSGADGEVLLDIEVVGGVAPGATQLVYFAPNTDAGFLDAVATATHASPTPTAISISWGQSEDDWTGQARSAMDAAFADAAALGVTVTAAAGDRGSTDAATGTGSHVDFPASSPHVLACGGTTLHADPTTDVVRSETVWNNGGAKGATGGGVSDTFVLPSWQSTAGVPSGRSASTSGRGVPDVAADADPQTGYQVLVDGQAAVIGGTSAVAPLWAGLVCRLAQALGTKLGLLQPVLYAGIAPGEAAPGFRDITSGSNGAYQAGSGWDPCTGLGVPDGTALLEILRRRQP